MLRLARRSLAAVRYFSAAAITDASKHPPPYPRGTTTVRKPGGGGRDTLGRRLLSLVYTKRSAVIAIKIWKEEGHVVRKYELNRIVRELRKLKRYKHALEVCEWMTLQQDIKLQEGDYAVHLDLIAKIRGINSAEKFFEDLPSKMKGQPTCTALLHVYVQHKDSSKAEALTEKMSECGFLKCPLPFNHMMSLYISNGQFDRVFETLNELKKNTSPDIVTYNLWLTACNSRLPNLILAAYINKNDIKTAEMFFEKRVVGKGIVPSYTSWELFTYGYIHEKQMDKVLECFKKAIGSVKKWDPDLKIVREVYRLLEEYGNVEGGEEVLATVRRAGFVSTEVYNLVLKVYVKGGKMALIVGERMKKDGVLMDDETRQLIKVTSNMCVSDVSPHL
ncbi:putative tetratricopeptide-like helical domain superfamily [Helianthus annuus]|nr:putative tetratricopeptide-like helical domain superfamily [Helianthus annuus]KAJ0647295.1 putative tetratricopeptide-like helical domain superfamily [Helianthus annuus]KAJ0651179.1 putative tetratricopeptide-like helical domain superfamily [Helianthus annuus]